MLKYLAKLDLTAEDVVQGIARTATTTMKDIASWDADGSIQIKTSEEMGLREVSAIKQIKQTRRIIPQKGEEPIIETRLEVALNDQLRAWELLGRYFALFVDRKQIERKDLGEKLKKALQRVQDKKKAGKVLKMVPDSGKRET